MNWRPCVADWLYDPSPPPSPRTRGEEVGRGLSFAGLATTRGPTKVGSMLLYQAQLRPKAEASTACRTTGM